MSIENDFSQPPRLLPRTIEDVLRAWMLRGGGVALVAAACIIWAAMLTWSAHDPSLSLDSAEPTQNLLGPFGAVIADFFFHTLGLSVIFFTVPLLVLGLELALGNRIEDHRRRLALFGIATVAIAAGCSALPLTQHWPSSLGYGGIIGDFTYSMLAGGLAEFAPQAAGMIAGLVFFGVGFWALSRTIGLDRCNIFAVQMPARDGAQRSTSRFSRILRGFGAADPRPVRGDDYGDSFDGGEPVLRDRESMTMRPDGFAPSRAADRFAEPEAPEWSLDEPLHAYNDAFAHEPGERRAATVHGLRTDGREVPMADDHTAGDGWHDDRSNNDRRQDDHPHSDETHVGNMAARFAPDADGAPLSDEATHGRAPQHHTVLFDDDAAEADAGGRDDLPNVLKRARDEAADILPGAQNVESSRPLPPTLPLFQRARDEALHSRADSRRGRSPIDSGAVDEHDRRRASQATRKPAHAGETPKVVSTGYRRPSLNLLQAQKSVRPSADVSPSVLQGRARMLEDVLADFRIKGEIQDVRPGPVITQFELEPSRGTKSARVIALADDVARSMSAVSARIAVVPGRNAIGIELPNTRRETFGLRELVDSQEFLDNSAKLPLVLGKGIGGEPVMTDLARMPHLLVAGTTGSGKSVGVNAMILSLIYRLGPEDCRFLMIDPKMLELSAYNGIPHLLTPVITDPQKAVTALSWAVGEMEERYKRMAELGVRSIDAFNTRVKHANRTGEKMGRKVQTGFDPATGEAVFEQMSFDSEPLPYIVIVVDEFADLMAVAGKEIEGLVQRLAQMARAAGIHMIMATQRPSVDVVTGTIKANFPTRISYRVASRIDSRTILNEQGGEQLLGQGDMLFLNGSGNVQRVHGPFVSDEEVEAVTNSLRATYPANYIGDVLAAHDTPEQTADGGTANGGPVKSNDLYDQAVEIVLQDQKASTSYLQRRLSIGYNRAADLIDRMEDDGVISAANHAGRRDILLAS